MQHVFAAHFPGKNFVPPNSQSWGVSYVKFGQEIGIFQILNMLLHYSASKAKFRNFAPPL